MIDSEELIDLDRVVFDPTYRRDVIEYLNRLESGTPQRTAGWPARSTGRGNVAGSIRSGRQAAFAVVQAKP